MHNEVPFTRIAPKPLGRLGIDIAVSKLLQSHCAVEVALEIMLLLGLSSAPLNYFSHIPCMDMYGFTPVFMPSSQTQDAARAISRNAGK